MQPASIIVPTRERLAYLEVALDSIVPEADRFEAEVIVIDDAGDSTTARELVEGCGARYEPHPRPLGLNVARNTGVERSHGELVVFVDDDVRARPGWLQALLHAAAGHPEVDVFTGPISAHLEGPAPRSCGREKPPITTLELGGNDTDTRFAWGSNMAIRRSALERVGPFDITLEHGGDEQEWQERLRAQTPGARVLYVAGAALEHRRMGDDARLRSLCKGAYVRGRAARRFDARRGAAPTTGRELLTLAGSLGHVLRYRCPAGLTMAAHSAGRLRECLRERRAPSAPAKAAVAPAAGGDDFLSGTSGTVGGLDALRRGALDEAVNSWELLSGQRLRLERAARHSPPRLHVLALSIVRTEHEALAGAIAAELSRSRHRVELRTCPPGDSGKFENLNALLAAEEPLDPYDWLLVIDDDVELPHGFLDRFLFLCERFSLALAQPAHRLRSHAAWPVTRRRAGGVVHETSFVEIGPVTAFARVTFPVLLPFPELRMGWGLDVHWAALAREHGWRCGVVDAVSIKHLVAPAAAAYPREAAVAEARSFLARRPYLSAQEAGRTLVTHRRW
ncbi:MAG TPA: glycosyltransferase family A protein [Solirubrobacteraceae bacterium]|jgi:GT2 family glycosyltransferase|nr:glycosyltransferase family A protein [Solirubrobacteraceae bacterium]